MRDSLDTYDPCRPDVCTAPAIGLLGRVNTAIALGLWVAIGVSGQWWFRRSAVCDRSSVARVDRAELGWIVVFLAVLVGGFGLGHQVAAAWYWVLAALATALPMVTAAFRRGCALDGGVSV